MHSAGQRLFGVSVSCPGAVIRNGTLQLPPKTLLRVAAAGVRLEGVTIRGSGRGAPRGGCMQAEGFPNIIGQQTLSGSKRWDCTTTSIRGTHSMHDVGTSCVLAQCGHKLVRPQDPDLVGHMHMS